jgi:hypothetical protein
MGAPEVTKFLTSLAVDRQVAASTQNQALSALLFLYQDVLGDRFPPGSTASCARSAPSGSPLCSRARRFAGLAKRASYTHVLNRGPAAVRSPADRMFGP